MHAHISALLEQAIIDGILELEVPIPESDGAVWGYDLKQMTQQRVVGSSKYKTMRRIRRIDLLRGPLSGDAEDDDDDAAPGKRTQPDDAAEPEPESKRSRPMPPSERQSGPV